MIGNSGMAVDVIGWRDGVGEGLAAGWRVNVTPGGLAGAPDLAAFVMEPARLDRVWAGDDPEAPSQTVALWFESEAAAVTALAPYAAEEEAL